MDDEETTTSNSPSQVSKSLKKAKGQRTVQEEKEQSTKAQSTASSPTLSLFSIYTRFMTHCLSFTRLCALSSSILPVSSSGGDGDSNNKPSTSVHVTSRTLADMPPPHHSKVCPSNLRGPVLNAIIGSAHYIAIFIALALRQAFPSSRSVISACETIKRAQTDRVLGNRTNDAGAIETDAIQSTPFDLPSSFLFRALVELPQHSLDILIATLSEFIMGQTRREEEGSNGQNSNIQKSSVAPTKSSSEACSSTWMDFSFQLLEHMTAIQSVLTKENISSVLISNNRLDKEEISNQNHCQSSSSLRQCTTNRENEIHCNGDERTDVTVNANQIPSSYISSAKVSSLARIENTSIASTKAQYSHLLGRKGSFDSFCDTKNSDGGHDDGINDDDTDPFDMLRRIKDDALQAARRSTKFLSQAWERGGDCEVRPNLNDSTDSLDANFENCVAAEGCEFNQHSDQSEFVSGFDEILELNPISGASSGRRRASESLFSHPKRQRSCRRRSEDEEKE